MVNGDEKSGVEDDNTGDSLCSGGPRLIMMFFFSPNPYFLPHSLFETTITT